MDIIWKNANQKKPTAGVVNNVLNAGPVAANDWL